MVLPFTIDALRRVATVSVAGNLSGRDLADTMNAVYRAADWQPGFDSIWHGQGIRRLSLEKGDLPHLVAQQRALQGLAGHGRDVIVVLRYHYRVLAEMYALMLGASSGRKTHVCGSLEEAHKVLGL